MSESLARDGSEVLDRESHSVYLMERPRYTTPAATAAHADDATAVTAEAATAATARLPQREGGGVVEALPSMADAMPAGMTPPPSQLSQLPQLSQLQHHDDLEAVAAALAAANDAAARNGAAKLWGAPPAVPSVTSMTAAAAAASAAATASNKMGSSNGLNATAAIAAGAVAAKAGKASATPVTEAAVTGGAAAVTGGGFVPEGSPAPGISGSSYSYTSSGGGSGGSSGSSTDGEPMIIMGGTRVRAPTPARAGSPGPSRGKMSKATVVGMATAALHTHDSDGGEWVQL